MNETEKPHNPPSGPGACRACAGYRFAVEEAVHVLAIHHHHPWEKAVDVSVALSWLRNALADLYADGPPNAHADLSAASADKVGRVVGNSGGGQ
jgi:hypothetical protein